MIKKNLHNRLSEGTTFNIQRFSLNDGPGIRTVIFFKGCPLRCPWCSNPESQSPEPELFYKEACCLHCGNCIDSCPNRLINSSSNGIEVLRGPCDACGKCASSCSSGAMTIIGKSIRADKVLNEVKKDVSCYRKSGGGITLSGGEPLLQPNFAKELLSMCKADGINTAVETCGFVSREAVKLVQKHTDLFLFDIKHLDNHLHRETIGADNVQILNNLDYLCSCGANIVIRVPFIPGFNSDEIFFARLYEYAASRGIKQIDLLPYHIYGENKYSFLGREYSMGNFTSTEEIAKELQLKYDSTKCRVTVHG